MNSEVATRTHKLASFLDTLGSAYFTHYTQSQIQPGTMGDPLMYVFQLHFHCQQRFEKCFQSVISFIAGHLRVVFDFGFERQELIFPNKHFGLGQYHDVRISRKNSGATLLMQVSKVSA